MQVLHTIAELRAALGSTREISLVPTMGNLHAGHLSLIDGARRRGGISVASIFVNPLQFAPHEDFAAYPRTLERDVELLASAGCDIAFAPSAAEIYPEPQVCRVQPAGGLADILEGSFRPGFFTGVGTVVLKLFNIVRPRVAVFGKKDYQQLLVIRNMVRQLALDIDILAGETVREAGGLALSSRNGFLNPGEHRQAVRLYESLHAAAEAVRSGRSDWQRIEAQAVESLAAQGWAPDYVAIRERRDLAPPAGGPLVILGAARLGSTRLIDNVEI